MAALLGEVSMEFCMEEFEKALGKKIACVPDWMIWDGKGLEIYLVNGKSAYYYWRPEQNGKIVKSAKLFIKSKGRGK
mgnify:CR=1 FL=1